MDDLTFDRLVRLVPTDASRRSLLETAGASALGALGLATLLGANDAKAKKRGKTKRGKKKRRCKPKPAGSSCQTSKDCCTKQTKRICGDPFNSPGDPKVCCGEEGTPCEFPSDCCNGFDCPTPGECVPL